MSVDQTRIGLPPLVGSCLNVLVLGSMPGHESLRLQEYYANKRNRFWRIMGDILGFDAADEYGKKASALTARCIGLWDVLATCKREGSLDTSIVRASEVPNPIGELVEERQSLKLVVFNGRKAAEVFRRRVAPLPRAVAILELPSTSPANAAVQHQELLAAWGQILPYVR